MSSSSLLSSGRPECCFPIPNTFKFLRILGEGSYGTVIKCVKLETGEIVAVKVNKHSHHSLQWEAFVMRTLMTQNMDNHNIVRYEGEIFTKWRMSLMYEMLDFSLLDYLVDSQSPMQPENIRTVIQQMAVALDALATLSLIHTDVKIDNIMLVDHVRQPFRVKLIDFGLAIFRCQAMQKTVHQAASIAAPEVILGLPVSEAIDIWSLGCTMGTMIAGVQLFPGKLYQEVLPHMTDLLGAPPEHLLNIGTKSDMFFKKTESDSWQLKGPDEYPTFDLKSKRYRFRSLDEMKMVYLDMNNPMEVDERKECIDLLKAMLLWDPKERITPSGILNHPFITKRYLNCSFQHRNCNEPEYCTCTAKMSHFEENLIHSNCPGSSSNTTNAQMKNKSPYLTCDEKSFSEDSEDKKEKKKRTRKNCFKSFFCWMIKKIGSSCSVDVVMV